MLVLFEPEARSDANRRTTFALFSASSNNEKNYAAKNLADMTKHVFPVTKHLFGFHMVYTLCSVRLNLDTFLICADEDADPAELVLKNAGRH